jgi:hypothetical protein
MPQHEEHCAHSEKRYGVRGDDIHAWMDEPSRISGASHRNYRHDLGCLPTAIQMFGKMYGAETVENIFLDHLKADSEENRKREQEAEGLKPKLWSPSDDEFLYQKFLELSDDELEAQLQTKSKTEIRKRREHLGLIRPKIIKRTQAQHRIQRIVFRLQRDQRIFAYVEVSGGNNDILFGFFKYEGASASRFQPAHLEKVCGYKSFSHTASATGKYCFYLSNVFSVFTSKSVRFSYNLENGKTVLMTFTI